jgi:methylmalonyl-CoA mutase cobalamin-binding domain/chain
MIAKPGLDGHERGAVVIAQSLHDAGFDVLYAGFRRTPGEIVIAAAEEDVDVLGLSCHSGAHLTLLKDVAGGLAEIRWRPTLLMAGGIIPDEDAAAIRRMGYDSVHGPGTPLESIHNFIRERVPARTERPVKGVNGWIRQTGRITQLELGKKNGARKGARPRGKIVTIAGPGGVGKSTLIGALLRVARGTGKKIAVLANDPVSAKSGGSLLADRLRMPMDLDPEETFIRSLPARNPAGGLSGACGDISEMLAESYDVVLVETVGIGQSESAAHEWSQRKVAVFAPGNGDHWQLRKNASLETCDIAVVSKFDLPEARPFACELEQVLGDRRAANPPEIFKVSREDFQGLRALLQAVAAD